MKSNTRTPKNFPYYEIELKPTKLERGEYRAGCSVSEHTGEGVNVFLPRWELKKRVFESKEAANRVMKFNAVRYLKREHDLKDADRVIIRET